MGKILVIGSSNVDFIMKMDRLPNRGETITDAVFLQTYGGKVTIVKIKLRFFLGSSTIDRG